MAEELKDLIEKIKVEGVKAAEDKAKSIEKEARRSAKDCLSKSEKEAENVISEARERVARMEKSGKDSLKQAGRDLILSLRKEINALLDKIIVSRVHEALGPAEMIKIITLIAKQSKGKEKKDITVLLNKKDLDKIEKSLLKELKDELKKGITLKSSEDIRGGFTISYDKGKSYYDFTEKALAEYIGSCLKPKLAEMLKK
ncbi:MAG: hypothetical protein WBC74_00800 [Candidatus Omnitrophota bacterium]